MVTVHQISNPLDYKKAQEIRHIVFVLGQNVPPDIESDKFEDECFHYLALENDIPVGAARWRFTPAGIKLERFAVLAAYRGKGIGSALVEKVLSDISMSPDCIGKSIYLNSQVDATSLYLKFGFKKEGKMFEEAGIQHYKMVLH